MNNKTLGAAVVLAVLLIASAPLASAGAGAAGDLSRTFPTAVLIRAHWGSPGIGIVGGTPTSVCAISIQTLQVPLTGVSYYESLRMYPVVNQNLATTPPIGPITLPPAGACPIPGSNPPPPAYVIMATAGTIDTGLFVALDALVGIQDTFVEYFPTRARWNMAGCTNPTFTAPIANDPKGLLSAFGVGSVLSTQIACTTGTVTSYTALLDTFGSGGFGTSISTYPRISTVFDNAGTGSNAWIVSCADSSGAKLDTSGPIPISGTYNHVASSHDWFYGIYELNPNLGQILTHLGVAAGHPLQGLYDLHGGNDCPFTMRA